MHQHRYVYIQLFLKQLKIFQAIYCGAWAKKIQPSTPRFARGPPNHLAWVVFYCTDDILCNESLDYGFPHRKLHICQKIKSFPIFPQSNEGFGKR